MLRKGDSPVPGFRLVKRLGRGQYGEVWQASGPFGVVRALKFIDVRGKTGLKEFRGVQNVKNISSPHLLGITDIWLLDEDWDVLDETSIRQLEQQSSKTRREATRTLAADLTLGGSKQPAHLVLGMTLANKTLLARLDQCVEETGSGIPVDELLGYMDDAARGIDYLNQDQQLTDSGRPGIQHCDIKPENIMLIGDGVAICDFGLAHIMEANIQATENPEGTIAYIAPEMLKNRPARTTDQYSLACSYYHLRTNQFPFDEQLGVDELMIQRARGILDFSALRGPRERKVLQRATALDAGKRFPSCRKFVSALRKAVDEDNKPPTPPSRGRQWVTIGCVLTVVALAGVGVGLRQGWIKIPNARQNGHGSEDDNRDSLVSKNRDRKREGNGEVSSRSGIEAPPQVRPEEALHTAYDRLIRAIDREDVADLEDAADGVDKLLRDPAIAQLPDEDLVAGATLALARARARLGQWQEVRKLLPSDFDTKLQETGRHICALLRVLDRTQTNIMAFFDDENLKCIAELRDDLLKDDLTAWERDKLAEVKEQAFTALVNDPSLWKQYGKNDSIRVIFPGGVTVWNDIHRAISDAERDLSAASPLSAAQCAALGKRLEGARDTLVELETTADSGTNVTIKKTETRIDYLRALVRLCVPNAGRADILSVRDLNWDLLPDIGFADCDRLCDAMLDVLEQNLLLAEPLDDQVKAVGDFITKGRAVYRSDNWTSYQSRLDAVTTIQAVWNDGAESQVGALAKLRKSAHADGLANTTRLLVDAGWLEAAIDKLVRDKSILEYRKATRDISPELDGFPDDGGAATEYIRFVLARNRYEPGLDKNAIAVLEAPLLKEETARFEATLTKLKDQPFMKNSARREFVRGLLLDAVGELKQSNAPYDDNPYVVDSRFGIKQPADKVLVCLNLAEEFGASLGEERLIRAKLLAEYWCSKPDYEQCLETARQLKLDPERPDDGALLFVRARSYANAYPDTVAMDEDARRQAIDAFAAFLKWHAALSVPWSKKDCEDVLVPALSCAEHYKKGIENFADEKNSVKIDLLPPDIRPALACIFGSGAKTLQDDPSVETLLIKPKKDVPPNRLAAIKYRYFHFRCAAALDLQLEYLVGQFFALRQWLQSTLDSGDDRRFYQGFTMMMPLAKNAYEHFSEARLANAMMGEALVWRSRYDELTGAEKRDCLRRAIEEYFAVALKGAPTSRDLPDLPWFYVLRSSARVEYAFRLPLRERLEVLKHAKTDAREAAARITRVNTSYEARLASGNAAEDIAFYCLTEQDTKIDKGAEDEYRSAIESFGDAKTTASRLGLSTAKANLSLGRTRLRYAFYLILSNARTGHDDSTVARARALYDQAITDLKEAAGERSSADLPEAARIPPKAIRCEAYYYLWQAYDYYQAVFQDDGADANKYARLIDEQIRAATKYATRWKWHEYQCGWAARELQRKNTEKARELMQAVVQQADLPPGERDYNVPTNSLVQALVVLFQTTPTIALRHALFEEYRRRPCLSDSACRQDTLVVGCQWRLLYADQWLWLEDPIRRPTRAEKYQSAVRDFGDVASELPLMKNCATETLTLIKTALRDNKNAEDLESIHRHALVASAMISYWQWKKDESQPPGLLNDAFQTLTKTLQDLFTNDQYTRLVNTVHNPILRQEYCGQGAYVPVDNLLFFLAFHYAVVQSQRAMAVSDDRQKQTQIVKEAAGLLDKARTAVHAADLKKFIQSLAGNFQP